MRALVDVPATVGVHNATASDVIVAGLFTVKAGASITVTMSHFLHADLFTGVLQKQIVFQAIADLVNAGVFTFTDATTLGVLDNLTVGIPAAEASNLLRAGIPGFIPAGNGAVPRIVSAVMHATSNYMDVTFSDGVWRDAANTLPIRTNELVRTFAQNSGGGGTATAAVIASVTKVPSGALTGGETVVRINLTVTGSVHGEETIAIAPASGAAIYGDNGSSGLGLAMPAAQTTGPIALLV